MFIDQAKIYIKAGDGGKGCHSLYRDKFQRRGVPDGGDGGRGGDIVALADKKLATLLDFRYRQHFVSPNGKHGSSNKKTGRNAEDLIIKLPCGTVIKDIGNECCLADLKADGQRVILAKGGAGGKGSSHKSITVEGESGQERNLSLELKLIADVGIIGFPNAGKSTLVSVISNAHPEIVAYPFTTKAPALGVVHFAERSIVVADIPGLIQGSHEGKGLGDRFLRHIEHTRLIIHLIDMAQAEGRDPIEDYKAINKELALFNRKLARRKQIIVANKMDLPQAKKNLIRFKKKVKHPVYPISAFKKHGLEDLIESINKEIPADRN